MSNSEKIARILHWNEFNRIRSEMSGFVSEFIANPWEELLPTDQNTFLTLADTICDAVGIKCD